jgi:hypothetical protein
LQHVGKRKQKGLGGYLEDVALLCRYSFSERQGRSAEEVNMHIARTTELLIFEVVSF